jgi:hypothetical protein
MTGYSYSDPVVAAFIIIPVAILLGLVWATAIAWRRSGETRSTTVRATSAVAIVSAAWMAVTWGLADSGLLRQWDRMPPPFAIFIIATAALAVTLAFSNVGHRIARNLPLWALVGVQGFRLPLELAMHAMYERGVMPEQMSYSGRNFDILTGVTAVILGALLASGRGRSLVGWWNALGLALLANVVTVAVLSTPIFRYFGDEQLNTWVTFVPFVWLPAVMVLAAFAGHLVIFRAVHQS